MPKPMLILESPLTDRIYATKAYKWLDETKGTLQVTGNKEDVTDQVNAIIRKRNATLLAELEELAERLDSDTGYTTAIEQVKQLLEGK